MFKIKKSIAEANVARTVRFTESLFDELNTIASENSVSFNALVLQCCRYALDKMEEGQESEMAAKM
jgi:predicted DNA-binding ribbon-helix-helix protein